MSKVPPSIDTSDLEGVLDRAKSTELGSYGYDLWGYHQDTAVHALKISKKIYDKYFRAKAFGLENIPKKGRLLIVANHSGQLPLDGFLVGTAMATSPLAPRVPRAMVERFFPKVPYIGNLLAAMGAAIGDPENCASLLNAELPIIVFPEGVKGSGKLFKDRYKLMEFGHGFMHLAMKHHTPILPVGVVGCEETIPSFANIKPLAKLLGTPYFPLAFPFPLPAKVTLHFGKPMMFDDEAFEESEIEQRVFKVKKAIRKLLDKGLKMREDIF